MMNTLYAKLLTALASVMLLASCNLGKTELAKQVADANDDCPEQIENGVTMSGVELDGGWVVFTYKVGADAFANVSANISDPDMSKLIFREMVSDIDRDFMREVLAEKSGIRFVFQSENGEKKELKVSYAELAKAGDKKISDAELFDTQLRVAQRYLPMDAGEGMKVVDFSKQGRTLQCLVDMTGAKESVAQMRKNVANVQADDRFTADDIEGDPLFDEAVAQGYDIDYVYVSKNSSDTARMHFPNRDLRAIMRAADD